MSCFSNKCCSLFSRSSTSPQSLHVILQNSYVLVKAFLLGFLCLMSEVMAENQTAQKAAMERALEETAMERA